MALLTAWGRRHRSGMAVALLAVLAYVPALLSSPGRMPADTKLYLYLDPGRLISDAPWTFDGRQFAGWVPHQVIAYLWPQGPWFWFGATLGLPDWITHRLWIGTLLFAAGAGVLWLARRFGFGVTAALAAALVYQLSPYVLPYISRTSAMLLPWAGLGWIVGLTMAAATRTRWRHAALCALVVASVGAVNATALLMVAPAPVLWLAIAAAERQITWGRAIATSARIGVLSLGVSAWWIAMVVIQGRHGADVLAYSESLESVSFTSTSTEVWRGLGYWLDYVRDPYAATTTAAADHLVSRRVLVAGFALLLGGVVGLVGTRWRQRRFAVAIVVTGVVLAVGVHPFGDPSPLMDALKGDGTSGAALALRSSTRAVPMIVLGLALGVGALVAAAAGRRIPSRHNVALAPVLLAVVTVLAILNMPSLTGRTYVDPALERDESPPAAWTEATDALDATDGGRVLQLPGSEFGAFRWGYTVDPPLPGLTARPIVTRDLLPLGSPAAMDLLYALDDRFQAGTIEPEAIAPVARWLGADTVWLTGDNAFDRFRTPRPEVVHELFAAGVAGLGAAVAYGEPTVNQPAVAMIDEQSLAHGSIGEPVPPVEIVPLVDAEPVIRAKDETVVVVGSGDGLVDAAAAGVLDGSELVRYAASLSDVELDAALDEASRIVVTDSNRRRAHHWRGSQDVHGYTESPTGPAGGVEALDVGDERLPVFGEDPDVASMTVAVQEGPVRATASAYGEPFAYRPEHRAVMAVDGDPTTAWLVADRAPAEGQFLRLEVDDPIASLTLLQPAGASTQRHIGSVSITVDDRAPVVVGLDDRSLGATGQRVDIEPTAPESGRPTIVTIGIDSVVVPDPADIGPAFAAVGFAEVGAGLPATQEIVVAPQDLDRVGNADRPVTFVFNRDRVRPTDRWRADPEPALVREFAVPGRSAAETSIDVLVRLDQRATDVVLADALGVTGPIADGRLTGVAAAAGWAAADGDPATSWTTPFAGAVGASIDVIADAATDSFTFVQPAGDHSPITSLLVTAGDGEPVAITVPAPDAEGRSRIVVPAGVAPGDLVHIEITAIDPRITRDRRYGEPVVLPAAISELSLGARARVPAATSPACRDDLLSLDGSPVAVRVEADVADLLAGAPVRAVPCAGPLELEPGTHRLVSAPGTATGFDVDRVVLQPVAATTTRAAGGRPTATVTSTSRLARTVVVDNCADGCWLVLGEGFHESWSASVDGDDLGAPQLVDGGFNGWWIDPADGAVTVDIIWTAQRPLNIALGVTALAVVGCLALALVDRRRQPPAVTRGPRIEVLGGRSSPLVLAVAAVLWGVAGALLVAPAWGVAGLAGGIAIAVLGRPRLAGYAALAMLSFMVADVLVVVQRDRPPPDAGWPIRFEHLHELGLFAAVSLAVAALATAVDPRPQHGEAERPADRP